MKDSAAVNYLVWILVAFFTIGTFLNSIFVPEMFRKGYARWGYPDWFHYVTAVMELAVVVLVLFPATRLIGAGLGAAIMVAVAGTVLIHREFKRAIVPIVVIGLAVALGWLIW